MKSKRLYAWLMSLTLLLALLLSAGNGLFAATPGSPRYIFLFIGDGMGIPQLTLAGHATGKEITATLLSIGRAIGDAAGVMFTAGFTDSIPTSLDQPAATLPLSISFQLSSPTPEVRERAYASALLLTLIVLVLSIIGRMITYRFSKNKIK